MRPAIAQVFYIGNGRQASGALHQIVVPVGATRFYFGVMDAYQWNNNPGTVSGRMLVEKH